MKMTPKDKIILTVFCTVLVLALAGFFGLRPIIGNWRDAKAAQTNVQAQKEAMDHSILCKAAVMAAEDSEEEKYADLAAQMPPVMKTYDIHYLMVDLAKDAKVKLNSLSIGNYAAVNLEDSGVAQAQAAAAVSQMANEISGGDSTVAGSITTALMQGASLTGDTATASGKSGTKQQSAGSTPIIYKSGVAVLVSGSYSNILSYLDGLAAKDFIHVKSFVINMPDGGGEINVNFSLEVYMASDAAE